MNGDARVTNASSPSSESSALTGKREWRRCRYSNGTTYDGYVRDGKRDGHGVYIDKAGNRYEGEWSNDRAQGYGTKVFSSKGDRHEGYYESDKRSGWGIYVWRCGDNYFGEWNIVKYKLLETYQSTLVDDY